jgi:hypothetical protein
MPLTVSTPCRTPGPRTEGARETQTLPFLETKTLEGRSGRLTRRLDAIVHVAANPPLLLDVYSTGRGGGP